MNARNAFARSVLPSLLVALASAGCSETSSSSDLSSNAAPPAENAGARGDSNDGQGSSVAERAIAEADIVQLSGGRLYAMSKSGTLSIVDVSQRGRLAMLGQAFLPGEPFEMYLRGDLLVLMTNGAFDVSGQANERAQATRDEQQAGAPAVSTTPGDPSSGAGVIVIDVKDPMLMQRVATFPVPGEIADSRIVGDILYLATYESSHCFRCGATPRTLVTTFDLSTPTAMRQVDQATFDSGTSPGWGPTEWKRSILVTAERMYVGGHGDVAPNGSNDGPAEGVIDVLDITDPSGKLGKGAHVTTRGAIRSRWQMDEHAGVLRVVSQRGMGWATNGIGNPELQTFHLWNAGSLQAMGKTDITMPRQEGLKAVRFDGDRAYAITFAQTDPLFVIDLSDEANPRQRGELVMPGWVFHLEPHGDRLLGLGLDRSDPQGHLNVSLFDVADMDHPKMLGRVSFGSRSYNDDHGIVSYEMPEDQDRIQKAFRVLDDGLVVVPYSGAPVYASSAAYGCQALGGGVQLIEWQQDELVRKAILPVAGNPRRALLNQGELLAVSDSNVTSFDIARRDVPQQTADLVIGTCETRSAAQPVGMPREARFGEDLDTHRHGYHCSSSSGVSTRGALGSSIALGLLGVACVLRRRRRAADDRSIGRELVRRRARPCHELRRAGWSSRSVTDSSGMKLPLATVLLSAAVMGGCGGSTTAGRYVMRVDRTYDRSSPSELPADDVPPESYRPTPPADRWEVTIDGSRVVLVPIGQERPGLRRLEGKETSSAGDERRFEIEEGSFAGGLFVMRGDEAELTVFGSGVPIVSSERGKLVSR